jgi:hypothetical protein
MTWIRAAWQGAILFTLYMIVWQVWIMAKSPSHVAHGVGYYYQYAPMFIVIGTLFVAFGVYLLKR